MNVRLEEPRPDFDQLWDYQKPAETEQKFRAHLTHAKDKGLSYYLQLLTQIARTLSLQEKYAEAYETLADVSKRLSEKTLVAKIRYLLELGRTQNAEKKGVPANDTFQQAFAVADRAGEWGYAVDALHMIAITHAYGRLESPQEKLNWEAKAIAYAESKDSLNAKKWLGSLYFNAGWSYCELELYEDALDIFTKAYALDKSANAQAWVLLDDRRTIARMKRLTGRTQEALAEELQLEKENIEKLGKPDGFVFEELGELYLNDKQHAKAREYFAKAYPLVQIRLTSEKYQARLARLKKLAGL